MNAAPRRRAGRLGEHAQGRSPGGLTPHRRRRIRAAALSKEGACRV